jgi:hypothetical protein
MMHATSCVAVQLSSLRAALDAALGGKSRSILEMQPAACAKKGEVSGARRKVHKVGTLLCDIGSPRSTDPNVWRG